MQIGRLLWTTVAGLALARSTLVHDSIQAPFTSADEPATDLGGAHGRSARYFQRSSFSPRYDERIASGPLEKEKELEDLKFLAEAYLSSFRYLGVQTWLMHDTLLGWWWNKQILPWSKATTVQVTEDGIKFLAAYYNMTVHYFKKTPFRLEVNPNYIFRDAVNEDNIVDARWINMKTGLFIDIFAISDANDDSPGVLTSKDGRRIRGKDLYPLLRTTFENVTAKIPYNYKELLIAEYGEDALAKTESNNHTFLDSRMTWVPNENL